MNNFIEVVIQKQAEDLFILLLGDIHRVCQIAEE